MGKRRFNAKGRQVVDTLIDNSDVKKIKLEIDGTDSNNYDDSNALVLPSNKRSTKVSRPTSTVTRILSKKHRKRLEKVVEKKKKKEDRSSLLDALASVQLSTEELKQYTALSAVNTKGFKRLTLDGEIQKTTASGKRVSSIAGRKKRLALLDKYNGESEDENSVVEKDPNILTVGTESDTSESDESEFEVEMDTKVPETKKEEVVSVTESEMVNKPAIVRDIEAKQNDADKKEMEVKPIVDKTVVKPTVYIHVNRKPEVQVARLELPILSEEQVIMEAIRDNSIVIIAGETGSGKTTQLPQFLYEAGYAENKMIGITEPRRVAAISMAKRVGYEMNLSSKFVSYLIRFEGNVSESTKIKFMTDGVLLKEIECDFTLNKYSVIILDEAHERSVYTDILVGLLSRIVPLRAKRGNPLKLIIMSATLRVEDFTGNPRLFKTPPPVIKVEARQYPVTIHFNKRTNPDYLKECYKKTVKIHNKLPEGGILVFLTGQREVNNLVRLLRKAYPYQEDGKKRTGKQKNEKQILNKEEFDTEYDIKQAIKNSRKAKKKLAAQTSLPKINLDNFSLPADDTEADLFDTDPLLESDDDLDSETESITDGDLEKTQQPLYVLPLYSLLSPEKQSRVFEPPPEGVRLCIVSTNIAETSLTIPNIKYVVDCGREKTRLYDKITGVSAFVVTFTSKASANQRAGRAGRTGPGHCYRLYSSAVYKDEMEEFAVPDIQKKPVEDLILQMKCMGIDKVLNFPFPSPPDQVQMEVADQKLHLLGALKSDPNKKGVSQVTPLGMAISAFPVAPRFGKMLALSHQQNLLAYTVCMVSALSVQEVLIESSQNTEDDPSSQTAKFYNKRKLWAGIGQSLLLGDPMILMRAVGAAEYVATTGKLDVFCNEHGLRPKAITEIRKLRVQLTNEINFNIPDLQLCVDPKLAPPTENQSKLLRQVLLAGMGDRVARKVSEDELKDRESKLKMKYAYHCMEMEEPVFIHPNSVLRKDGPEWIIYQEAFEIQNGDNKKMFVRGITAIEPEWLHKYAAPLCNIRNIRDDPSPTYNKDDGKIYCYVDASYGRAGWELPTSLIEMPFSEKACKFFAMYLLNGDVFEKFSEYKKQYRTSPKTFIASWAHVNPIIIGFVNQLVKKQVCSRDKLKEVWKTEPKFLLEEFAKIIEQTDIGLLALKWPIL